jgi:hypothetical protein
MKSLKASSVVALLLVLLIIAGCGSSGAVQQGNESGFSSTGESTGKEEAINLRFMAAPQSGSWYPLAVGITEMLKKNMSNLAQVSIEPGGGVANIVGVNQGQAQMGFSQAAPFVDGLNGNPPFQEKMENIRYMLSLFPHKTHIVVLKDSGIDSIEDIRGKRINVGTKGLLTEDLAARILKAYGMTYDDMASVQNLSFADSIEQMKDGRLDVLFWTVPVPFAVLTDLSQSKDIKLLPIPEDKRQELIKQNPGLVDTVIESGTYKGVDEDIPTIQSPLIMLAHKDAPEELVYQTTKTVAEGLEELKAIDPSLKPVKLEDLPKDIGAPLHPGAERYFKEIGLIQ